MKCAVGFFVRVSETTLYSEGESNHQSPTSERIVSFVRSWLSWNGSLGDGQPGINGKQFWNDFWRGISNRRKLKATRPNLNTDKFVLLSRALLI